MSVACMTWVFSHSTAGGSDRLLLLAIADTADDAGGNAWPAVPTLARKTGISVRSVQRGIQRLEAGGHLEVERGAGRGGTNRYQVVMAPATGANVTPPVERPAKRAPRQPDTSGAKPSPVPQLRHRGGDTQVSPERPERPITPQPPEQAQGAKCAHGRSTNCRRCGTSPRGIDQRERQAAVAAAVAEVDRIERERADLPWCGDPDCSPLDRWRSPDGGRAHRCPDCNPDVVIGRPTADQLKLAAEATDELEHKRATRRAS